VRGSSGLGAAQEAPALPRIQKTSMSQCYLIAKHVKEYKRQNGQHILQVVA
jgi:hypothetical protein